jgi:hypothetical protein
LVGIEESDDAAVYTRIAQHILTQQQLVFVVVVSSFLLAGIESAYTMHAHQKRVCTSDRPSSVVFLYHSMQSFTFRSLQELHNKTFLVVSNCLVGRNR